MSSSIHSRVHIYNCMVGVSLLGREGEGALQYDMGLVLAGYEFACIVLRNATQFETSATHMSTCIAYFAMFCHRKPLPYEEIAKKCYTHFVHEIAPWVLALANPEASRGIQ